MGRLLFQLLFILSLSSVSLFGYSTITKVKYEGGISLFGRVAEADVVLEEDLDKKTYKMSVTASSVGVVRSLTGNRIDKYVSEGIIENGIYKPLKFTKSASEVDSSKVTVYTFDYENSKVLKEVHKEELVQNTTFDITSMRQVTTDELVKHDEKKYIKIANNDFISLFLNLSKNNLKEGSVDYIDQKDSDDVRLIGSSIFEVSKDNGDDVYKVNFSKNSSMFFDKAVALDIAFYGDAYLKKISEEKTTLN